MARSSAIQGFLATGDTLDELFQIVPDVTEVLYAVCREQGGTFVKDAPEIQPKDIVWLFELPYPVLQAA